MEMFSLHTTIQRFVEFGTHNLQKAIENFISHPEDDDHIALQKSGEQHSTITKMV